MRRPRHPPVGPAASAGLLAAAVAAAAALSLAGPPLARARDLASVSWKEFAARSELVVAARLVSVTERMSEYAYEFTFEIDRVFRGPKGVSTVTFRREPREAVTTEVGAQVYLMLRAKGAGWELSVDERSCWRREHLTKPDFHSIEAVDVPDTLVRDIPKTMKKEVNLKTKLPGADYHEHKASVYLAEDIERFLAERFK